MPSTTGESNHEEGRAAPSRPSLPYRVLTAVAAALLAVSLTACSEPSIPGDAGYGSPAYTGPDAGGR